MSINLDRETQKLIDKEIEAGRFRDAAGVVNAAVRHFVISREDLGYSREQIDAMIAEAITSLERGEGVDGEEFFEACDTDKRLSG